MTGLDTIFSIAILIMSVVIHEVSHAYFAYKLGDPTAKLQGRITLNPLKHLELFGSFIVPLVTSLAGATFGWAKPVPINPYNFKKPRRDELIVSLVGPASNLVVALIFALLFRGLMSWSVVGMEGASTGLVEGFVAFAFLINQIIFVNIALAVFNLLPIPPLDGSSILFALIPRHMIHLREQLTRYSMIFVVIFIVFLWQYFAPVIPWLYGIFVGR